MVDTKSKTIGKLIEQDGNIDIIVFKAKRYGFTGNIHLKLDKEKMTVMDKSMIKQTTKRRRRRNTKR